MREPQVERVPKQVREPTSMHVPSQKREPPTRRVPSKRRESLMRWREPSSQRCTDLVV